ncbi:uncharacterized protein [Arachis hypogaea]|uniref:uncharacterized protein n=1 Tax=Arachis hypogaea TaxID=3818 RepID=UPI003B20E4BF
MRRGGCFYGGGGDAFGGGGCSQHLPQAFVYASPSFQKVQYLGHTPSSVFIGGGTRGTSALSGGEVVSETQDPGFLYMEDFELMLMRACSTLAIGAPIFVPQDSKSSAGCVMFRFIVFLPSNARGLKLVAYGPESEEEKVARQEVSFAMLEKLVDASGKSICDYNYRVLGRMKQQMKDEMPQSMFERIRMLEEENAKLRHQVKMIEEMLAD